MKGRGEYPRHWRLVAALVKCRARWCCEHCGHQDDVATGHVLTVHHLDGDKSNCANENLVALCQACHLHWQARFYPGQVVMDFARPAWMVWRELGK